MTDSPHEYIEKLREDNRRLRAENVELKQALDELHASVISLRDKVMRGVAAFERELE